MKLNNQSGMALDELLASAAAILLFPVFWILFCKGLGWPLWMGGLVAAGCAYVTGPLLLLLWNWVRQLHEFFKERQRRRQK